MSVAFQSYELYKTSRAQEWMMRVGDPRTPAVLFVPPLFEELNRTRALIVAVMRALAREGHCGWLPDLTGTSESLAPLEEVAWDDWKSDVMAAAEHVAEMSGLPSHAVGAHRASKASGPAAAPCVGGRRCGRVTAVSLAAKRSFADARPVARRR